MDKVSVGDPGSNPYHLRAKAKNTVVAANSILKRVYMIHL